MIPSSLRTLPSPCRKIIFCLLSILLIAPAIASEVSAKQIAEEYDRAVRVWAAEMRMAQDPRDKEALAEKRPSSSEYARRMRKAIRRSLDKGWTLTYAAWLLENDPVLRPGDQRALLGAVEKYHKFSPKVGRFCVSLINLRPAPPKAGTLPLRRRGMNLLREIRVKNPDKKVQGQAALALCMMMASLGDDFRILTERRNLLREAITKSADVKIGETTVAELAKEELYKMKNLTKGRVAPDFAGVDSSNRPMRLSDHRKKVVMLVFWSSTDMKLEDMATVLKLLRKTVDTYAGKPFVLLGVNRDSQQNLRGLEADAVATWRSFSDPTAKISKAYRITRQPYCIILNKDGVIQYSGNLGTFATATVNDVLNHKPATKPATKPVGP